MEIRRLGRTNFNVAAIGFGGIPLQRVTEEEATKILSMAESEGMNFIDSARAYGKSEELIGKAIEASRRNWIIATKSVAKDYNTMKKDVEISLSNLRTHYIDLYQLHLVRTMEQFHSIMSEDGAYKALKEAQEEGRIKEIGITSHSLEILEYAIGTDLFSTIQFPYNIVEDRGEDLFKKAFEKNIGVIVMKPLAGGALNNADLALRFTLQNPYVSVVIPGIDSIHQIKENCNAAKNKKPLTKEEIQEITRIREELGSNFCRRCGYCLPCPQDIDIPSNILMEGYFTRYELQNWALERYNGLPKKASDCILCGVCETKCPYNLEIREILKKVKNIMENIG